MIPAFDPGTGALPPGDQRATLDEMGQRLGFTPRRRWLLKGLRAAVNSFWAAGIEEIYIDGSFCTEKPDPGDIDGYWVEPDPAVYYRIDPYSYASGNRECGLNMVSRSLFIPPCNRVGRPGFQNSFATLGKGAHEA